MTPNIPKEVAAAFAAYPAAAQAQLTTARRLIFEVADEAGVGPLTETLKWGEPAYLTEATKAGSTVRLGVKDGRAAAFFICHTGLVDGFRADYPEAFPWLGNRGLVLESGFDAEALAICFRRALTYHREKQRA